MFATAVLANHSPSTEQSENLQHQTRSLTNCRAAVNLAADLVSTAVAEAPSSHEIKSQADLEIPVIHSPLTINGYYQKYTRHSVSMVYDEPVIFQTIYEPSHVM